MRFASRPRLTSALAAAAIAIGCALALELPALAQGLLDRVGDPVAAPARVTNPAQILAAPPPAGDAAAAKAEDARKFLVVGDFLARTLADGLAAAFAADPGAVVVDRVNGSSGLVRSDFYNWSAELPAIIAEVRPAAIIVMLGANDRQDIRTAAGTVRLRSPAWDAAYAARAAALVEALRAAGAPVFWVGEPPMRQTAMSADMAFFNSVYADAVEAAGGVYVDIWDAFADADGRFAAAGPDIDGRTRTLRATDGFSFTAAGQAKLAFLVERALRAPLDARFPAAVAAAPPIATPLPTAAARPSAGPLIVLGQPPPGAPADLLDRPPAMLPGSPQYRLFVLGETLPPTPGRADDFAWPKTATP